MNSGAVCTPNAYYLIYEKIEWSHLLYAYVFPTLGRLEWYIIV